MTTRAREDYLRALFIMEEEKGRLKSSDVAAYLHVSRPTVSEMVRRLDQEGLIRSAPYSELEFTAKGKRIAAKLTSKHRIIELFLKDILKRKKEDVHDEAHRLEHAFSDESIGRLRRLLGNPAKDPHGKPIPR